MADVPDGCLPPNSGQRDWGLEASALPRLRHGPALHDHADPDAHAAELQKAFIRES